jgi:hypothetical protein
MQNQNLPGSWQLTANVWVRVGGPGEKKLATEQKQAFKRTVAERAAAANYCQSNKIQRPSPECSKMVATIGIALWWKAGERGRFRLICSEPFLQILPLKAFRPAPCSSWRRTPGTGSRAPCSENRHLVQAQNNSAGVSMPSSYAFRRGSAPGSVLFIQVKYIAWKPQLYQLKTRQTAQKNIAAWRAWQATTNLSIQVRFSSLKLNSIFLALRGMGRTPVDSLAKLQTTNSAERQT